MEIIPKGTRLYRSIDTTPDQVTSPMQANDEGVLWCAADSSTAAAHIPAWGLTGGIGFSYRNLDEVVRPEDDVTRALIRQCSQGRAEEPSMETLFRKGAAQMGVTAAIKPQVTWREVIGELDRLGYAKAHGGFCWLKMGHDSEGNVTVVPAKSQVQGTLLIMETTEDMQGSDRRYDPSSFSSERADQDFHTVSDYCQTEKWGIVSHISHAIHPSGQAKLKVIAVLPAVHNDWANEVLPHTNPCPEELAWKQAPELTALPPVPDLRRLPSAGAAQAQGTIERVRA